MKHLDMQIFKGSCYCGCHGRPRLWLLYHFVSGRIPLYTAACTSKEVSSSDSDVVGQKR